MVFDFDLTQNSCSRVLVTGITEAIKPSEAIKGQSLLDGERVPLSVRAAGLVSTHGWLRPGALYSQSLLRYPWAGLPFGGINGSHSVEENTSDSCLCFSPVLLPLNHNLFSSDAFAQKRSRNSW